MEQRGESNRANIGFHEYLIQFTYLHNFLNQWCFKIQITGGFSLLNINRSFLNITNTIGRCRIDFIVMDGCKSAIKSNHDNELTFQEYDKDLNEKRVIHAVVKVIDLILEAWLPGCCEWDEWDEWDGDEVSDKKNPTPTLKSVFSRYSKACASSTRSIAYTKHIHRFGTEPPNETWPWTSIIHFKYLSQNICLFQ